jgi:transcriptional activator SPT8
MEDMEDGEGEDDGGDADGDGEGEGDEDVDMDADADEDGEGDAGEGDDDGDDEDQPESPSPSGPGLNGTRPAATRSPSHPSTTFIIPQRPSIRPAMVTAELYDIVPTIAAPQSTSINAVCATPNNRYVFTGGSDGYIRKFNWIDTVNGKLPLTVAQKHPFVDSVVKAGVLASYWENADTSTSAISTPPRNPDESVPVSPVYSLAVHHQALWLMSGDETGAITMQTVRHSEGTRITQLRKHTSAVSVLNLALDERSVLSGSWDRQIHDWDLNTAEIVRTFSGGGQQISSIERRPQSSLPVPTDTLTTIASDTFQSNNADRPSINGALLNETLEEQPLPSAAYNDDDMDSLFGDDAGAIGGMGDDDDLNNEFTRAILQQPDDPSTEAEALQEDLSVNGTGEPVQSATGNASETIPGSVTDTLHGGATNADGVPNESTTVRNEGISNDSFKTAAEEGLPHSEEPATIITDSNDMEVNLDPTSASSTTFLESSIDGTLRIWDRRQPNPIARITPQRGTPPWCMSACWSPDGNFIYAGRRNNTVDEYSLHKGLRERSRTFSIQPGSGPVSSVRAMPNGRHLICASYDILRLYDLSYESQAEQQNKHSSKPAIGSAMIIPGHRTGVISQMYIDPSCTFLITTCGNRGWEGISTQEVLLGYEIAASS